MPEQYRIYEFKQPNNGSNWRNNITSVLPTLGIILIVLFLFSFLGNTIGSLIEKLPFIPIFIISLVLHELSHAYMADFLGDPTPRLFGRLSLNPVKHLDLWGTMLFIFCGFGWAKPVPVNANHFRNPDKAMASVALAGPICNFLLAILAALVFKICLFITSDRTFLEHIYYFCFYSSLYNLMLATFNLLPIPPLDGSRLVHYLLPIEYKAKYYHFSQQYSFIIFMIVFFYAGKLIGPIAFNITKSLWSFII